MNRHLSTFTIPEGRIPEFPRRKRRPPVTRTSVGAERRQRASPAAAARLGLPDRIPVGDRGDLASVGQRIAGAQIDDVGVDLELEQVLRVDVEHAAVLAAGGSARRDRHRLTGATNAGSSVTAAFSADPIAPGARSIAPDVVGPIGPDGVANGLSESTYITCSALGVQLHLAGPRQRSSTVVDASRSRLSVA
jgi:hypothetical protein